MGFGLEGRWREVRYVIRVRGRNITVRIAIGFMTSEMRYCHDRRESQRRRCIGRVRRDENKAVISPLSICSSKVELCKKGEARKRERERERERAQKQYFGQFMKI